jgi:hypothetical protein
LLRRDVLVARAQAHSGAILLAASKQIMMPAACLSAHGP